jgi:hypothetical protein
MVQGSLLFFFLTEIEVLKNSQKTYNCSCKLSKPNVHLSIGSNPIRGAGAPVGDHVLWMGDSGPTRQTEIPQAGLKQRADVECGLHVISVWPNTTRHRISNSSSIFIWSGAKPFCRELVSKQLKTCKLQPYLENQAEQTWYRARHFTCHKRVKKIHSLTQYHILSKNLHFWLLSIITVSDVPSTTNHFVPFKYLSISSITLPHVNWYNYFVVSKNSSFQFTCQHIKRYDLHCF